MECLILKYEGVDKGNDSIKLYFIFDHKDPNVTKHGNMPPLLSKKYFDAGILYIGNSDTIVGYLGWSFNGVFWAHDTDPNSKNRHVKALQPEVISYINDNKDKIHPWFRHEAIKRGVLKHVD